MTYENKNTLQNSTGFSLPFILKYSKGKAVMNMAELVAKVGKELKKITIPDIVLLVCAILSGTGNFLGKIYPFGIACTAGLFMSNFTPWAVLFVLLGKALIGIDTETLKYLLTYMLLVGASVKRSWLSNTKNGVITTACCMLTSSLVYGLFMGIDIYYVFENLLELLIVLLLVPQYKIVCDYFSVRKIRRTVTRQELTALSITACGCLSGLSGFILPFDISVIGIVCTFIIFFCAYNFSIGVCGVLGTVLGLLASLASHDMIYAIGSYSVAALVCGMLRQYGKGGIVLGFILSNAAITFYVNGSEQVLINLYEILIAGGIFAMLPKAKLKKMKNEILVLLDRKSYHEQTKISGFKEVTFKRLNRIADALSVLSLSMQCGNGKKRKMNEETADMLAKNVKERVCRECAHSKTCEEQTPERDEMLKNLIVLTEKRGWVEQYDVPFYFKNRCFDSNRLVLECNKVFELYRVNRVWENRISENRGLISSQLNNVSTVVKNLADELYESLNFEDEMEQKIISVLDGLGIHVANVQVMRDFNNRLSVTVHVLNCSGKQECAREIRTVLKKVTGKTFSVPHRGCDTEKCILRYRETENFGVSIGVARVRPDRENKSGDSYSIIRPEGGKIVIALSDGMGTGEKAAKESGETLSLLEHLLLAGIDKEAAIKLINSVLILKSYDDNFATLDLLIADLYTGEGEMVKTGGASSYICREGEVAVISANALPTGIIGDIETGNRRIMLKDKDAILIASDGITDISKDDKWLKDLMILLHNRGAQEAADLIMKEAVRRVVRCKDDMTLLYIKISEK